MHGFTPQVLTTVRARQGHSQESGTPSMDSKDSGTWAATCCLPGYSLAGSWIRKLDWKGEIRTQTRTLILGAGSTTRYATKPAETGFFTRLGVWLPPLILWLIPFGTWHWSWHPALQLAPSTVFCMGVVALFAHLTLKMVVLLTTSSLGRSYISCTGLFWAHVALG